MNIIPPPKHSDGITINPNLEAGWTEAGPEYISLFFKGLIPHIARYYMQLPDRLPTMLNNAPLFTQDAQFNALPLNYKLYFTKVGHVRIYGHPSGQCYNSVVEFLPHLLWLIHDNGTFTIPCNCSNCNLNNWPTDFASASQYPVQQRPANLAPSNLQHDQMAIQHDQVTMQMIQQSPVMGQNMAGSVGNMQRTMQSPTLHQLQSPPLHSMNSPSLHHVQPHVQPQIQPSLTGYQQLHLAQSQNPSSSSSYNTSPMQKISMQQPIQPANISGTHLKSPSKELQLPSSTIGVTESPVKASSSTTPKDEQLKKEHDELLEKVAKAKSKLDTVQLQIRRLKYERRLLLEQAVKKEKNDDSGHESVTSDHYSDDQAEGEKKKKKRKKMKFLAPDAPKRPANAYMLFCEMERDALKEERERLRTSMPGSEEEAALSNITKALGNKWKALSEEEKNHYKTLFKQKVGEYNNDLAKYIQENPESVVMLDGTEEPAATDKDTPKRPANAFMLFCDMERETLKEERKKLMEAMPGSEEEAGLSNIPKALGQRWKALSSEERKRYQDKFKEMVDDYEKVIDQRKSQFRENLESESDLLESVE